MSKTLALGLLACFSFGCHKDPPAPTTPASTSSTSTTSAAGPAEIGQPAPAFTLVDLDGKEVSLASFAGKTVVLEWFNPGCPFVKRAHEGTLKTMAADVTKSGAVVWLAINSGAPGKQGAAKEANVEAKKTWNMSHPVLLDPEGKVGKAYGATNTPHMFVVDPKGVLVYAGALDDTKGGEPEPGDKVQNYVGAALEAVAGGKSVATSRTKAWGCSVKYGQ